MKTSFMIISVLITCCEVYAQSKFMNQSDAQFKFEIAGLKDKRVYLGRYEGLQHIIIDSAVTSHQGMVQLEYLSPLPNGLYFLFSPLENKKSFQIDFILTGANINLATTLEQPMKNLNEIGDETNNGFSQFVMSFQEYYHYFESAQATHRSFDSVEDSLMFACKIKTAQNRILNKQKQIIENHSSNKVAAKIMQYMRYSNQMPIIQAKCSIPTYHDELNDYYMNHYWDHIDFSDSLLSRLPYFTYQVEEYLSNLNPYRPEPVKRAIDRLVSLSKSNSRNLKELLSLLLSRFASPKIMKDDVIFVYLVDRYLSMNNLDKLLDEYLVRHYRKLAEKTKQSLVGSQALIAPAELKSHAKWASLVAKSDYLLLYFYNPDCHYCDQEYLKLVEHKKLLVNKKIALITISTVPNIEQNNSKSELKDIRQLEITQEVDINLIKECLNIQATPSFYLLNSQLTILDKGHQISNILSELTNQ